MTAVTTGVVGSAVARLGYRMGSHRAVGWIECDRLVRRRRRSLAHAATRDLDATDTSRRNAGRRDPGAHSWRRCRAADLLDRRWRRDDGDRGDQRIDVADRGCLHGRWALDSPGPDCDAATGNRLAGRRGHPSDRAQCDADRCPLARARRRSCPRRCRPRIRWCAVGWRRRIGPAGCSCPMPAWSKRSPRRAASCC